MVGVGVATVCCIYHKPRPFDESSSDESSSDESHAGGDTAKPSSASRGKAKAKSHSHRHGGDCTGGPNPKEVNKLDGGGVRG